MSLQNYSCPKLGSLNAENMRVPGLNQMRLAKTRTYQMVLQMLFLPYSPYPRLYGNSHFKDRSLRRTLLPLILHTSHLS